MLVPDNPQMSWCDHSSVHGSKNKYNYRLAFITNFESWLKNQLLKQFGKEYKYHLQGVISTNVPLHQGLYVDNDRVFEHEKLSALVYHILLCKDGLRLRIANIVKEKRSIILKEKIVAVQFGDGILLDSTQIHSGNYGVRGNL